MAPTGSPNEAPASPKGGGAISGIGEKFSADPHTGTGSFSIPLELLPGRNSFEPQLTLAYNTGNGDGPFGTGWQLAVGTVTRKTSKSVPRYDEADVFILAGAEDLVPVEHHADGTVQYRPRTEGLFARILHRRSASDDYWEVWRKDGSVSYYGTPGEAGVDPAVIANPIDPGRVFCWKLSSSRDVYGNLIEYEYLRDRDLSGPNPWDQIYLKAIRYADYDDAGQRKFLVSVELTYSERPDVLTDHRARFEVRTRLRCTSIDSYTHAGGDTLIRRVGLVYHDELPSSGEDNSPTSMSLLGRVTVTGYKGGNTQSLPPLDLDYTRYEPNRSDLITVEGGRSATPFSRFSDLHLPPRLLGRR